MATVERHESPDRAFTFLVDFTGGDWTVGFEGYPWHTHGDILAATEYPSSPEQATRSFVTDLLASRRPIVIWRVNRKIRDFGVPDPREFSWQELVKDLAKYGLPGETVEARYWDGRPVAGEPADAVDDPASRR